jgi:hypothetical protein
MSYSATLDGNEKDAIQVATNKGWGDVIRWVDSLPNEGFSALKYLANTGESDRLAVLPDQIAAAREAMKSSDSVGSTLDGLVAFIANASNPTTLIISSGA